MIEFVGLVPFLGESHYGLPLKPCVLNAASHSLHMLNTLYLCPQGADYGL